jgi:hypothetical protein
MASLSIERTTKAEEFSFFSSSRVTRGSLLTLTRSLHRHASVGMLAPGDWPTPGRQHRGLHQTRFRGPASRPLPSPDTATTQARRRPRTFYLLQPTGHATDDHFAAALFPKELVVGYNRAQFMEDRPMAAEREALRDWHRLFGLLLKDFFTGSPFNVEVEQDLSVQQQLLDVTIVRRGRGRFAGRLPDGLGELRAHNLVSFKSRHEALDGWAIKELVGADVAYRKLVSPAPSQLLPQEQFGLYAVAARFPHNLSGQVPWQRLQAGVYDCRWGTDTIRVVVAGELPQEAHNAPLHLFSAAPSLVEFGGGTYERRSEQTSRLLGQLFEKLRGEGFAVSFTMEDFNRQYTLEHFSQLTPAEQRKALERLSPEQRREVLQALPPEDRLADLSTEQIRQYLAQRAAGQPTDPRKRRRKK